MKKRFLPLVFGLLAVLPFGAFAETAPAASGDAAADSAAAGTTGILGASPLISTIIMIVAMIAIFYFFLIRPQRKKEKAVNEMRKNLQVGDEITTIGGIVGHITQIKDDTVVIETGSDKARLRFKKWAISTKEQKEQA